MKEATANLSTLAKIADPYIRGDIVQLLPAVKARPCSKFAGYKIEGAEAETTSHRPARLFLLSNLKNVAAECGAILPATKTVKIERPKDDRPTLRLNLETLKFTAVA